MKKYMKGAKGFVDALVRADRSDMAWEEGHLLNSLVLYHQLVGEERVCELLVEGVRSALKGEASIVILAPILYAYRLTGDEDLLVQAEERWRELMTVVEALGGDEERSVQDLALLARDVPQAMWLF